MVLNSGLGRPKINISIEVGEKSLGETSGKGDLDLWVGKGLILNKGLYNTLLRR